MEQLGFAMICAPLVFGALFLIFSMSGMKEGLKFIVGVAALALWLLVGVSLMNGGWIWT